MDRFGMGYSDAMKRLLMSSATLEVVPTGDDDDDSTEELEELRAKVATYEAWSRGVVADVTKWAEQLNILISVDK